MKALKIIGIALFAIVGIYLILCLIGPKDFDVTRTVTINAPGDVVFEQVAELQNWNNWSPWHEKDPNMTFEWGEVTRGQGASYSWESETMGSGSLEVIEFEEGSFIKNELDFGFFGSPQSDWSFVPVDGGVEVSWHMAGTNPFITRGMGVFMDMETAIGEDFDAGLKNLKTYSEEGNSASSDGGANSRHSEPEIVEMEAVHCLCINDTTDQAGLSATFSAAFPEIAIHLGMNGQEMMGQPLAVYYGDWDPNRIIVSACCPVAEGTEGKENMSSQILPAGKYVKISHFGDYEYLNESHDAMEAYVEANNIIRSEWVYEQYVSDPMTDSDPANWQTDIYYPIKEAL